MNENENQHFLYNEKVNNFFFFQLDFFNVKEIDFCGRIYLILCSVFLLQQ